MWDIWGDKYAIICLSFWSYFEFMWAHIFSWACRRIGDHHYHTELIICGDHRHHTDNDDGWGRSLIRFSSSSHASSSTLWPSRLLHNLWGVNLNFWPFSHFECKFWMKWGQKIVTCSKQVWWRSCQRGRQWEHRQGSAWGISKLRCEAEKTVARRSRG